MKTLLSLYVSLKVNVYGKITSKKIEDFLDKERSKARLPRYERLLIFDYSKGNYLKT